MILRATCSRLLAIGVSLLGTGPARAGLPNDPLYADHLQTALDRIRMPQAWEWLERTPPPRRAVVAVLDTGIAAHPDLLDPARLLPGYDFVSDPALAGDGDGRDGDPTDAGGPAPSSSGLHGLHLSGLIAASTGNGLGMAAVAGASRLLPVRVLGVQGGRGAERDIADAIRWAAGLEVAGVPRLETPADVINLGFSDRGSSFLLQGAIDDAIAAGAIVVAAAGDHDPGADGKDDGAQDALGHSPGGLDRVITVGAATSAGERAPFSNYGLRVDLLAPGENLYSTYRDLGAPEGAGPFSYHALSGTAQAAALVSGAAALARSYLPLRQEALALLLQAAADRASQCAQAPHPGCGAGLLNVQALLELVAAQAGCACPQDQTCLDGGCVAAGGLHPSRFRAADVAGGCSAAPAAAGTSAGGGLALLFLLALRRGSAPRRGLAAAAVLLGACGVEAPIGTAERHGALVQCDLIQWWNYRVTYQYSNSYGTDNDMAGIKSWTPIQLRHDSKLINAGTFAWGFMPEFVDQATGHRFRLLHLHPQKELELTTAIGTVYPAGTVAGYSGGDTWDTGYNRNDPGCGGVCSTGAHLCTQVYKDSFVNAFPPGDDPCGVPIPPDRPPHGVLDAVDCQHAAGWAQDPDEPQRAIVVHVYLNGAAGQPGAVSIPLAAGGHRDDLCGAIGSCDHAFSLGMPHSLLDGQGHPVHAYGIDTNPQGQNAELGGSPKVLQCAPPSLPAGVRRWVPSGQVFGAWKFDSFWDLYHYPPGPVEALPEGPELPAQPQLVQADDGSPDLWVLDGEVRRRVANAGAPGAWRFGPATRMAAAQLSAHRQGPPWRAAPLLVQGAGPATYIIDDDPGGLGPGAGAGAGESDSTRTDVSGGCSAARTGSGATPWGGLLPALLLAGASAPRRRRQVRSNGG